MKKAAALLLAWLSLCGFAHVQGGAHYEFSGAADSTVSEVLPSTVTSGGLVACYVGWGSTTAATLTSVTDDKANTYVIANSVAWASGSVAQVYLGNITNAPQTITANFSPAETYPYIICDEYSGVATTSYLDGHAMQLQNSVTAGTNVLTSGNITTTVNGDLIYGGVLQVTGNAQPTAGTGFTGQSTTYFMTSENLTQGAAGAVAATGTTATSALNWITGVMAFKPVAGVTANKNQLLAMGVGSGAGTAGAPMGATRSLLTGFSVGSNSIPSVPVHTWLGYFPDISADGQSGCNPNGSGGNFGCANPGGQGALAYPWVIVLDIGQVYGCGGACTNPLRFTYANMANGSLDADYNAALNALTASDKASIYMVRIDHEFEAWSTAGCGFCGGTPEFVAEGAQTDIAAWRHLAGLVKAKLPNAKVFWNPGGGTTNAPFDYSGYWPGGTGSNIDGICTDGGYFQNDVGNGGGGAPQEFLIKVGVTQANAGNPSSYPAAAKGTVAWFVNFAKTAPNSSGGLGVPVALCEWGDQWQKAPPDGSAATASNITAMAAMVNNPANNFAYHLYWDHSDIGSDLSALGQAAFATAWAHAGGALPYNGVFAPFKTPPATGYVIGGTEVY